MSNLNEINVLALCGGKRNGKDTASTLLLALLAEKGIEAKRFALADTLKVEVALAFHVSLREIEENKDFFRPILQVWGTEFRRKYQNNDNYWVEQLLKKLYMFFDDSRKIAIITDVRYPNEMEALKNLFNTKSVYINRILDTDAGSTHSSEHGIKSEKCDYILTNNDSIESLAARLKLMLGFFDI